MNSPDPAEEQADAPAPPLDARPADLEVVIPKVLRAGLLAAVLLMAGGLLWFALRPPSAGAPFSLVDLPALLGGADPRGVIGAGILILLLTPLARVVASLAHFVREKDRLYAALTSIVILNLAAAIALGVV